MHPEHSFVLFAATTNKQQANLQQKVDGIWGQYLAEKQLREELQMNLAHMMSSSDLTGLTINQNISSIRWWNYFWRF